MTSKQSFFQKVISTINLFDVFGNKVQLTVFSKPRYSTMLSNFFSVLIYVLSVLFLSDDIMNLLNRTNPQVINSVQQTLDIPTQNLEPQNFTFALSLLNTSLIKIDDYGTVYQFIFQRCNRTRFLHENGQIISQNLCHEIPMEQCSMEKNFASPYAHDYFKGYTLKNMRCIDSQWFKNNLLNISGQRQSAQFVYFKISIKPCQNSTSNNTCAPIDVINKKLNYGAVDLFMSSSVQDDTDINNPYHFTIKAYTSTFQKNSFKTIWTSYIKQDVYTDDGLFKENIRKSSSIQIDSIYEIQSQYAPENQIFCEIGIYLVDSIKTTKRSYTKIQQIMGTLGGFYSILFQVFFVILRPLMNSMMKLDICCSIFKNDRSDNEDSIRNSVTIGSSNETLSQKQMLIEVFKIYFGKSRLKKQIEFIDSCLDISYIIKQLFILEKLKLIVLNESQLHFIENITIEQHLSYYQTINRSSVSSRTQDIQEIQKILRSKDQTSSKKITGDIPLKIQQSSHRQSYEQKNSTDLNTPNINDDIVNDEGVSQIASNISKRNHLRMPKFKEGFQHQLQ